MNVLFLALVLTGGFSPGPSTSGAGGITAAQAQAATGWVVDGGSTATFPQTLRVEVGSGGVYTDGGFWMPYGADGVGFNNSAGDQWRNFASGADLTWYLVQGGLFYRYLGIVPSTGAVTAQYSFAAAAGGASGVNAFAMTTNNSRFDLGTGASDYLYSDGTNVHAAANFAADGTLSAANLSGTNTGDQTKTCPDGQFLSALLTDGGSVCSTPVVTVKPFGQAAPFTASAPSPRCNPFRRTTLANTNCRP